MERKLRADDGAQARLGRSPWDRLGLALVFALIVHLVVVLGADPFRDGLRRFREALGLARPAAERTAQPRDDDWIRIVLEPGVRSSSTVPRVRVGVPARIPVKIPIKIPVKTPVKTPVRSAVVVPPKVRPARPRLLASLTRPPTGLVKPPLVVPERAGVEPRMLEMRDRAKPPGGRNSVHTVARPARRRLDLVYRPGPGELRVAAVDKGRLRAAGRVRVAGRERVAKAVDRGAVNVPGTGRWTPLPKRLRVPRGRASRSGGFRVDGRGGPVYAGVRLKRVGKGRWRYYGPKCTFNATIGADGQVTFRDLPSIAFGKVKGSPPLRIPGDSQARGFSGIVVGVSFTFDVTDAVMRGLGEDPYSAEKLRFARLTRAWRLLLRAGFLRQVRREAVARFGPQAGLCRRYRGLDAQGRRRTRRWLFARWDETREDTLGRPLRAAVVGAIRRCGIRYPVAELAGLNAKRRARGRARGQGRGQGRGRVHFTP